MSNLETAIEMINNCEGVSEISQNTAVRIVEELHETNQVDYPPSVRLGGAGGVNMTWYAGKEIGEKTITIAVCGMMSHFSATRYGMVESDDISELYEWLFNDV